MPRRKTAVPIERYTVMSQAAVGERLGLSAMRVCQIEKAAFAKIRIAQAVNPLHCDRACDCFIASGLCRHRVEQVALPPEREPKRKAG
ncbi:MAG: hypothetical protein LAN84_00350 [Acidobacteriia bacterium]|nr:hypothetical protein [Terriglobia bacterium]